MGGKALKTIKVSKMDQDSFLVVSTDIIKKLRDELKTDMVDVLPYYKSKNTFSDIDLLISKNAIEKYGFNNFHDFLKNNLNSPEQSGNSQIYSFGYKYNDNYHQVDLMIHSENMYNKAKTYFAYNDLNILMNFLSTSNFDLTFKKDGLNQVIYGETQTQKIDDYTLDVDFYEILDFLGLNKEKHKIGFNSLNDIYDFIYESPYFDSNKFIKKTNKENREELKRAERKTYSGFTEYVKNKPIKKSILEGKTIEEKNQLFFYRFPKAKEQYTNILKNHDKIKEMRKLFNGFIISKWLNIEIKDKFLGAVMRKVKLDFKNDETKMADWLKENGQDRLKEKVILTASELSDTPQEWSKYLGGRNRI